METSFGRLSLATMNASTQAASVQRRFLRRDCDGRNQPDVDCGERDMGGEPAHGNTHKC
jgi:hypothetical protein